MSDLIESQIVNSSTLLLLANIPLAISVWLTQRTDARGPVGDGSSEEGPADAGQNPTDQPGIDNDRGAFRLIREHRYLILVAAITLVNAWVNTNGENLLFRVVQESLAQEVETAGVQNADQALLEVREKTTEFYGDFFFWVNLLALVLQALVASRLLAFGGFGAILLLLPSIALIGYTTMAFLPVLAVVRVMKIAENATDYSINNTASQVLWLPTTAEMKFKAKPAIATFCVRLGDGLAALTVLVGVQLLALSTRSFFLLNAGLVVAWLFVSFLLLAEHRRITGEQHAG